MAFSRTNAQTINSVYTAPVSGQLNGIATDDSGNVWTGYEFSGGAGNQIINYPAGTNIPLAYVSNIIATDRTGDTVYTIAYTSGTPTYYYLKRYYNGNYVNQVLMPNAINGLAADTSGKAVYVSSNNQILKIVGNTITVYAGNGTAGFTGDGFSAISAQLNTPSGLAIDKNTNDLYIIDGGNQRIRKVTASTGNISTIAGNGTAGFTGDGSFATSAEINMHVLNTAICTDDSGNVYFYDQNNVRIRKIELSGIINTITGNGTFGFSGDGGNAASAMIGTVYGISYHKGVLYFTDNGPASQHIRAICLPIASYSITGGGSFCGTASFSIGLSNSQPDISYQLYVGSTATGSPIIGTGSAITFGTFSTGGTYSITASTQVLGGTSCAEMIGGTVVVVSPLPASYNVTGGGSYCAGGVGVVVGLSNSASSAKYRLYNGGTLIGSPLTGTGAAISFNLQTAAGTYTVSAVDTVTSCIATMTGDAVITMNPLPTHHTVSGSGTFTAPTNVNLSGSQAGVNYQLHDGTSTVGSTVAGTGTGLVFPVSVSGTYFVVATSSFSCIDTMTGSAVIVIDTTTGVPTITVENTKVYPIPFTNTITIASSIKLETVQIVNMLGIIIYEGKENTINTSRLSSGVYILKINGITKKIVKD